MLHTLRKLLKLEIQNFLRDHELVGVKFLETLNLLKKGKKNTLSFQEQLTSIFIKPLEVFKKELIKEQPPNKEYKKPTAQTYMRQWESEYPLE